MTNLHQRRSGLIILSMPRAGSSWLGSLTDAAGTMGIVDEWLDFGHLPAAKGPKSRPLLNAKTLQSASTPNGNFAVKIFPRQLLQVIDDFEYDFIRRAMREHTTKLVLLEREDKKSQAVSLVRAMQTGQWRADQTASKPPHYNFGALAQAYFHICRGYTFWRSYLALQGFPFQSFTYEDLVKTPAPYLAAVAAHFGEPAPTSKSPYRIQRDPHSADWRARFEKDIQQHGIPASAYQQKQPEPGIVSAFNVLRGKPAKTSRFGYST